MKIDENILNSNIEYCIDEYVRLVEHRDILREKWFYGYSLDALAAKHNKSLSAIKDIVYGKGDQILLKAAKMKDPHLFGIINRIFDSFLRFFIQKQTKTV